MKRAVQGSPTTSGMELANWYWKGVRQFVFERFGVELSRSSCLNWLHRLGFSFKRPKKRLVKANKSRREAFVAEYAALREEARKSEARILFADEAHFRAEAELRGKWVLRGEPALVDSTSPQYGEKASYFRRCAWRRAKWNGWNWRGTVTPGLRLPSWNSCAGGLVGVSK